VKHARLTMLAALGFAFREASTSLQTSISSNFNFFKLQLLQT
jgi:hypothetical protein